MSNWDLMMPGMGLTAIGVAGVTISYAGIARTFVDGMHALTGLTMFFGLIILAAGILEGGVSTSNRAKATTLVVLGISFSFGIAALTFNAITTIPTFAGVMLIVTIPAIVTAYVSMKMPQYTKPISIIFIIAVGAAIAAYVGFGLYGPSQYLVAPPVEEEMVEEPEAPASTAPVFAISILKGSATQGNPDYDPDVAQVPLGNIIEWTNNDDVSHTVTSAADAGGTFDSGLLSSGATYRLDTAKLQPRTYDYLCIVHPWMTASFVLGGDAASGERLEEGATAIDPNFMPPEEMPVRSGVEKIGESPVEEPVVEEPEMSMEEPAPQEAPLEEPVVQTEEPPATPTEFTISIPAGVSTPGCEQTNECFSPSSTTIPLGSTITWTNDDTAAHTVTSGKDATPDGAFDSGLFMVGKTFSHKFESAGEYPYYCLVHPWMAGTVTVE
ncbi:MAG: plastocyanin/azurin family copper-binding protein [Candidatus Nitrosotenuis sp.]